MTDDVTDYMQLDAVNISTLIHMLDGPKAYAHAISAGFDDSPAMAQGRALHCLVLEPDQFERRYVVSPYADLRSDAAKAWPDLFRLAVFEPVELTRRVVVSPYADYRTKAAQAWKADQLAANMTIIRDEELAMVLDVAQNYSPDNLSRRFDVITQTQAARLRLAAEEVLDHPQARRLLYGGEAEEVWEWADPATGILCKGRTDYLGELGLVDLKSTVSVQTRRFAAQSNRLGYPVKMGWYQWAVEMVRGAAPPVFLIAVQLEPYVDVGCFSLSAADLLEGRRVAQTLLKQLADCRKSGRWPGLMEGSIAELPVNWSRSDENADAQA